jgi:hypothetical protein
MIMWATMFASHGATNSRKSTMSKPRQLRMKGSRTRAELGLRFRSGSRGGGSGGGRSLQGPLKGGSDGVFATQGSWRKGEYSASR